MNVEIASDPTKQQIAELKRGLRDYNSEFVSNESTPVRAVVTDDSDQVIAGIDSIAHWGKVHVGILWVDADHRGKGLGVRLMRWAEEQGRAIGCHAVVVDTLSFQAPGFYRKLGYTQFGATRNYEGGHGKFYFEKEI